MTIIILFGSLLFLILLSVPIGFAIGLSTLITIIFSVDNVQLVTFAQKSFTALDSFPLMAIPFFIFAGMLMSNGGVARRLVDFVKSFVGNIHGGLAIVTVLVCMFFASISGSGPATVAAIGSFMIPAMNKQNYNPGFSSAITAASGAMGPIIPPSISFILLGVAGQISISSLFLGGVIPGIIIGVVLSVISYFLVKRKHVEIIVEHNKIELKNIWKTFFDSIWAILSPVVILGGIYSGLFTPTEASAVAIVYALIVGIFIYKELNWGKIYESAAETLKITGAVLHMTGLSLGFAYLLSIERIPSQIAEYILNFSDNWIIVLILINLLLLIVGAFIDVVPSIIILTPILLPVATQIGVDPIHFGVIMVLNLTIGYITPPMGVNLFVASAVGKTSFDKIVRSAVPIFIGLIIVLALVTFIPELSLMLPNLFN